MFTLPRKLIAVGMRFQSGAQEYIENLRLPVQVSLILESNDKASDGKAVAVYHGTKRLAYIREADLGLIRPYFVDGKELCAFEYTILSAFLNYLVLQKLEKAPNYPYQYTDDVGPPKKTETFNPNPCNEISITDNFCQKKEQTMFEKIVANNKTIAVTAAYMEAGRIANNQVAKLVAAKAPLMVRGYVDTPIGKLVWANLTAMAVEQFRPGDLKLKKVANAMMSNAYQSLIQTVDIEGMLNELTSSDGIQKALNAVTDQEIQS